MKSKKVFKMIIATIVVLVAMIFSFTTYKHIRPISWNMHNKMNQGVKLNTITTKTKMIAIIILHILLRFLFVCFS